MNRPLCDSHSTAGGGCAGGPSLSDRFHQFLTLTLTHCSHTENPPVQMPPLTKEAGTAAELSLENPSSDKGMADYNENRKFQSAFLKWQTSLQEHSVIYHGPSTASPLLFMEAAHAKHQKQTNKTKKQLEGQAYPSGVTVFPRVVALSASLAPG